MKKYTKLLLVPLFGIFTSCAAPEGVAADSTNHAQKVFTQQLNNTISEGIGSMFKSL